MKGLPAQPSLYQINARVWLTEVSKSLSRPATLDDIPDAELDRLAEMGFDWIWLLSTYFHKYTNVFTAKSQRAQRVGVYFYPTVRGGRIKGSLSASGRNLHKAFASKRL